MNEQVQQRLGQAKRLLNWLWLLISLLVLIIILLVGWQHAKRVSQHKLQHAAATVRAELDNLLSHVLVDVYTLPIHGLEKIDCKKQVLALLENIRFNHPNISGLSLS